MKQILKKVTRKFKKLLVIIKNLLIILSSPSILANMMREDGWYGSTSSYSQSPFEEVFALASIRAGRLSSFLWVPKDERYAKYFDAARQSNRPNYFAAFIEKTKPDETYLLRFYREPGAFTANQVGQILMKIRYHFYPIAEELAKIEVERSHYLDKLICAKDEKTETIQPVSPVDKVTAFYLSKAMKGSENEKKLIAFWLWVAKERAKEAGDTTSVYYSNLEEYSKRVKPKTRKQWWNLFHKPRS